MFPTAEKRGGDKLLLCLHRSATEKVFVDPNSCFLTITDMVDAESHPRPRRTRHDSAKHYDVERKDLELSEVLDVLQCYVDYGGGINCCVCGKLYKSRVCFIKHLWEHTIYWDLFDGDKNHLRVLSIQAALILYGTCQQPLRPVPVDSLLVTSPHSNDHGTDGKTSAVDLSLAGPSSKHVHPGTPRRSSCLAPRESVGQVCSTHDAATARMLPTTPVKKSMVQSIPKTPVKTNTSPTTPKTPKKKSVASVFGSAQKRRAPPRLDLGVMPKKKLVEDALQNSPSPLAANLTGAFFQTPVKQRIPCMLPKTPKKKNRRRPVSGNVVCSHTDRRVSRFLVPTADISSNDRCWKEGDACASKRKRSE